jgi:hypothetical protein
MKSFPRYVVWLSLTVCVGAAAISRLPAAETDAGQGEFSAAEQAAREKIIGSEHWKETRAKFRQWLSVQSAYSPQELAKQEAQLKQHIGTMSAADLKQFLAAMDERLGALLSPEMDQARSWVDHYYTKKAQLKMAQQLGVEDPLKMSGSQLDSALKRFEEQRTEVAQSSSAFNRSRQSQTKNLQSYRKNQQAAEARARSSQRSATFSKHAPVRTQSRQTRYPSGFRGGRGGWGGW